MFFGFSRPKSFVALVIATTIGCSGESTPPPKVPLMSVNSEIANAGAIVCKHVALKGYPILRAERSEAVDPADSGWQFLCYSGKPERIEEAQIWAVSDVVDRDPTLLRIVNAEVGTAVTRLNDRSEWQFDR